MNTNKQIKSFKDPFSLEFEESRQICNGNSSETTTALMVKAKTNGNMPQSEISQSEIWTESAAPKESSQPLVKSTKSNNNTPRLQATVEFAAKQLFQILLVDIKRRNAELNNEISTVPGAICV
jgi:hypothetical protein